MNKGGGDIGGGHLAKFPGRGWWATAAIMRSLSDCLDNSNAVISDACHYENSWEESADIFRISLSLGKHTLCYCSLEYVCEQCSFQIVLAQRMISKQLVRHTNLSF